jgi:hypothetical protein
MTENPNVGTTSNKPGSGFPIDGESVEKNLSEIQVIVESSVALEEGRDPLDTLPDLDDEDDDAPKEKISRFGLTVLIACVLAIIIGVFVIRSNPKWMADLECFWSGSIQRCKMAPVEELRAQWREEEAATRPMYGDVTLVYHPQDAKVTIEQTVRKQAGWKADIGSPETVLIENRSTKLREHELIESLPLENLPIREREQNEQGEVTEVRHYTYRFLIEREGYEPREFAFEQEDWVRLGPDVNYSIQWSNVDLIPKPETIREPFSKAMREIYCARVEFAERGEKAGQTRSDLDAQIREIQVRHGFRTMAEFSSFEHQLTADEEWWNPVWEEIRKEPCPQP